MYQLCRYARRTPLNTNPPIKYGDIVHPTDSRISAEVRERFIKSGTLVVMDLPPLSALPENWQGRATLLAAANIHTIGDLLEANDRELARAIRESVKTIRAWKQEAETWLQPTNPPDND